MSARAVEASGSAFSPRGDAFSDVGVALDEILPLTGNVEPVVLRVAATGGSRRQRELVSGDWLCADHETPRRIPRPSWGYNTASVVWSRQREWLEAWETCGEVAWMMSESIRVGVSQQAMVLAACSVARRCLHLIDGSDPRPRRAIELAERWASMPSGSGWVPDRHPVGAEAEEAADNAADRAGSDAAWAALHAREAAAHAAASGGAHDGAVMAGTEVINASINAAGALAASEFARSSPNYDAAYELHYGSMADAVRERITTLDVLRLVAERGTMRP